MAATADGIVYPIASDFIAPLNTHLQNLAESTQDALDAKAPSTLTTYIPTFTGLTLGNGTVAAKYCKVGAVIVDEIVITFGSTTAITGSVTITGMTESELTDTNATCGQVSLIDSGTANYAGIATIAGATSVKLNAQNSSSSYVSATDLSATVPHTWAVSDKIIVKTVRLAA